MRKFVVFAIAGPLLSGALGFATAPELPVCESSDTIASAGWQAFEAATDAPTDGTRVTFAGQGTCEGNYTINGYTFAVTK